MRQHSQTSFKERQDKKLLGITADFPDAKAEGLQDVLGRDFADKILRGCKVHISN